MNFNLGPKNFFKNDHSSNEWIPLSLAAKLTPYSSEYLSLLARKKKLSAKKIDNTWYTTKAIVDEYMHRQMVRAQIQNGSLDSGKIKPIFERASEVAPASGSTSKISSPVFAEEVFVKEKVRPSFAEFPHPNFASVVKPETTNEKDVHIVERGEEKSFFMDEFKKIGESLSTLNSKIEKTQEDKTIEDDSKKIKSVEKVLPLIPPLAPKVTIVPEIKEKVVEAPKPFDISAVVKREVSSQLGGSIISPISVVARPMTTGSKIKFGALTLTALVLFIILPIPVVFGMFDTSLHAVKDWMKDSQTVLGFRPGTHANELLLLNDKGEISILGSIETEGQLKSFAKQGIPPLVVTSSTTVANLSVQYLNGLSSDDLTAIITDTVIKKINSSGILVSASGSQTTNITLGTTEEALDKRLTELANLLKSEIYRVSSNATTNYNNNFSAIALTQRIDNLSNVRINNAIITNSTFSGTTGTFETLTVTGTGSFVALSANSFNTQSLTATGISNLATTTIASLTVTNLSSFQDVTFANATGTSATTTNFFASILHAATGVIDTFSSSVAAFTDYTAVNGTTTNATSTNLFAQNITAGDITATGTASFATTTTTNLIVTASSTLQDFTFNNATGTSATTTNFFATTASSTNLFASLLNIGNNSLVVSSNGNVGVGTSSPTDVFSVDGPIYLSETVSPSVLDNRLYNNAGVLYFGGVAVGSGLGSIDWSYFNGSGTRLATTTNQVLIGAISTSTSAKLEVVGDTYISGLTNLFGGVISNAASSTISNLSIVNSTTTSATSTNLFSTLFRATTGVIDNFSSSFASITEYTATNSTTTNATTTNLFAQNITATNITATGTAAFGTTTLTNLAVTNTSTSTFNGGLTIGGSQFVVQSSTGNVGIGTIDPRHLLTVGNYETPIGTTAKVGFYNAGTSLMIFRDTTNDMEGGFGTSITTGQQGIFMGAISNHDLMLRTNNSEKVRITTAGNVGIGTTSPFVKLSVAGDAYIGGNLTATGTVSFLGGLTSLSNLWVTGSSTLQDFTFNNATGTSATTTSFFTSILRATSGVIDNFSSSVAAFTEYTAVNSTTTNATTTNLFAQNITATNITATGTAAFGTTTLTNLAVTNTSTSTFNGGLTIGGSQFVVQSSTGNVGIGTSNPAYKLSLVGDGSFVGSSININDGSSRQLLLRGPSAAGNSFIGTASGHALILGTNAVNYLGISSAGGFSFGSNYSVINPGLNNAIFEGLVGIGTTSPFAKLSVAGDAYIGGNLTATGTLTVSGAVTAPYFVATDANATSTFAGGLTVGSTNLSVSPVGNIGIGIANPAVKLDIGGGANYTNTTGVNQFFSSTGKIIQVRDANQSSLNLISDIDTTGAVLGAIAFSRSAGQADSHVNVAGINATQVGTGSLAGGTLQFWTKSNGGSVTEPRMVIDNAGNVGVGTTTPGSRLSVSGGASIGVNYGVAAPVNGLIVEGNVGIGTTTPAQKLDVYGDAVFGTTGAITLDDTGSGNGRIIVRNIGSIDRGGDFYFRNLAGTVVQMIVTSSGNVGIGTTSPFAKLSVAGDAYIGGNLTATGTLTVSGAVTAPYFTATSLTQASTFPYASTTALTSSGSAYFATAGGNVGIGTTTPAGKLTIYQGASGQSTLPSTRDSLVLEDSSSNGIAFLTPSSANSFITFGDSADNDVGYFGYDHVSDSMQFAANGAERMRISSTGNVGIGMDNPSEKLSIGPSSADAGSRKAILFEIGGWADPSTPSTQGSGEKIILLKNGAVEKTVIGVDANNSMWFQAHGSSAGYRFFTGASGASATSNERLTILNNGNVGIGTTTPWAKLAVNPVAGDTNQFVVGSSSATSFVINPAGKVGIGTSTPFTNLSVVGSGYFSGALGIGTTNSIAGTLETSGNIGAGSQLLIRGLLNCSSGSQALKTDGSGQVSCGSITALGGTSAGGWTWISPNQVNLATTSDYVVLGTSTSTPYAKLFLSSGAPATTTLAVSAVSSQTADILHLYNNTLALDTVFTASGLLGLGTTTPSSNFKLSVAGNGYFTGNGYFGGDLSAVNITSSGSATFSSLGKNMVITTDGNGTLVASSTPQVSAIFATSTTATSTFAGGLTMGSNGFVYQQATGRVGIGTSTPWATLSIEGTSTLGNSATAGYFIGTSTTATSTFGYSVNIDGGCFAIGGACVASSNSTFGSGVPNALAYWSTSNTILSTTSPTIGFIIATSTTATSTFAGGITGPNNFTVQSSSGNVGIGTTTPSAKLQIGSTATGPTASTETGISLGNTYSPTAGSNLKLKVYESGSANYGIGVSSGSLDIVAGQSTGVINFYTNGTGGASKMIINASGLVGIGTTSPFAKLSVAGDAYIGGNLTATGTLTVSGAVTAPYFVATSVTSTSTFAGGLTVGSTNLSVPASGNVGIGIANPAVKLDIGGGVNYTNTTGVNQFFSPTGKIIQVRDANQSSLNLISDIDTTGAVLGAIAFSRSAGQADSHVNVAGINATQVGTGSLAGGTLQFWTKSNGGSVTEPRMVIDNAGNVGVGTIAPNSFKLQIAGNVGPEIDNSYDLGSYLLRFRNLHVANIFSSSSPTFSSLGKHMVITTDGNGTLVASSTPQVAAIFATSTTATSTFAGGMTVDTNSLVVDYSTGRIGVGTVSPFTKVGIIGDVGQYSATPTNTGSPVGSSLYLGDSNFVNSSFYNSAPGLSAVFDPAQSVASSLAFYTYGGAPNSRSERMRINSVGIGIGTTTPLSKLAISGGASIGANYNIAAPTNGLIVEGNVGIGTTTPFSKMSVTGAGVSTGRGLSVANSSNLDNFYVLDNGNAYMRGNVGIGTTTPGAPLHVQGNAIFGNRGTIGSWEFTQNTFSHYYGSDLTNPRFAYQRDTVPSGGSSGTLLFANSTQTFAAAGAGLGSPTTGALAFFTSNGSALVEHLRINSAGLVGIGTTSPFAKLSVAGDAYIGGNLTATGTLTVSGAITAPYFTATSLTQASTFPYASTTALTSSGSAYFATAGGNVGIGTTVPGYKLHVGGDGSAFVGYNYSAEASWGLGDSGTQYTKLYRPASSPDFRIWKQGSGDVLTILNTGNVGIGTTSPANIFSIATSLATPIVSVDTTATNGSSRLYFTEAGTLKNYFQSIGSTFATTDRQNDFEMISTSGDISFYPGGSQTVSFKSGGNVGIGTTTPNAKLQVNGQVTVGVTGRTNFNPADSVLDVYAPAKFVYVDSDAAGEWGLKFRGASGSGFVDIFKYTANGTTGEIQIGGVYATYFPTFYSGNAERMRITTAGNVGIGTTSPFAKLSVAGDAYIGGNLTATGTLSISGLTTLANLLVTGSSTLQNFTFVNATGTSATTTNFYSTTASSTNLFATLLAVGGNKLVTTASGNVGIGTNNPTVNVDVNGTGDTYVRVNSPDANTAGFLYNKAGVQKWFTYVPASSNDLRFYDGSDRLTIQNGGNVGIGTTNPSAKLTIGGTSADPLGGLSITTPTGASYDWRVYGSAAGAIQNGGGAGAGFHIGASSANSEFWIGGYGNVVANTFQSPNSATAATITAIRGVTGQTGDYLQIRSTRSATNGDLLTVNNLGKLGLGTTTPTVLLTVGSSTPDSIASTNYYNSAYISGDLEVDGTIYGTTAPVYSSLGKHMVITTDGSGTLVASSTPQVAAIFATSTTATSTFAGGMTVNTNSLVVDYSSGKVGVGTVSPSVNLDVEGVVAGIGSSIRAHTSIPLWGDALLVAQSDNSNTFVHAGVKIQSSSNPFYIYQSGASAANVLRFNYNTMSDTGGQMVLTSAGLVGIGTTSPFAQLSVQTTAGGSTPLFTIASSTSGAGTSTAFHVANNGYVGVGTAAPLSVFDMYKVGSGASSKGATFRDNVTPTYATNADNLLTVRGTGSSVGTWRGRITAGGDNFEFLMGEYNSQAWLGAHNAALNAWADLYISPDGNSQKTHIGSIGGVAGGSALTVQNSNGYVGIGSTTPWAKFSINPNGITGPSFVVGSSTATSFVVDNGGRVGIGTSTPNGNYKLSVVGGTYIHGADVDGIYFANSAVNDVDRIYKIGTNTMGTDARWAAVAGTVAAPGFAYVSDLASGMYAPAVSNIGFVTAGVERIRIGSTGLVGIGTTSPYAKLSVVGPVVAEYFHATSTTATSTFDGGLNVGSGDLTYDFSSGVTSVSNLNLGATSFDADSGALSWIDMPVTSDAAIGTVESYTAHLDGNALLTVYGESDGAGSIQNYGVGIGSSTPWAKLSVVGTSGSTRPIFQVASSTNTSILTVNYDGNVGIGTTSPFATLSVNGSGYFAGTLTATNITATGTLSFGTTTLTNLTVTNTSTSTFAGGLTVGGASGLVYQQATGNVGIGTANPGNTLDVQGTFSVTSGGNTLKYFSGGSGLGYFGNTSASDLGIITNGGERMRITTTGNVGIGTTTPATKLNVVGDKTGLTSLSSGQITISGATTPTKQLWLGLDTTNNYSFIQSTNFGISNINLALQPSNGNVGIGTTTPNARLSVFGNTVVGTSTALVSGSAFTVATESVNSGSNLYGAVAVILKTTNSDISNSTIRWVNQQGTYETFLGRNFNVSDSILEVGDNTTTKFIVDSSGNVGIGTTTPSAKLDIYASDFNTLNLGTSNGSSYVRVHGQATTGGGLIVSSNNFLRFDTGGTLLAPGTERMRVDANGNLGIGTTSPFAKLSVAGDAYIGGNLTATGTASFQNFTFVNATGTSATTTNFYSTTASTTNLFVGGNVGIGTNAPGARLDVNGTIRNQTSVNSFANSYTTALGNTRIINQSNPQFELWHDGNSVGQFSYSGGTLNYGTHGGAGTQTTYLTILSGGKVGIGDTTPTVLLTVGSSTPDSIASTNYYNSAYISGDLEVDGTIYGTTAPVYSSLGKHMVITTDGSGTLVASSTPQVAAIFATSTTATSTFAGGITGPNSFTVQSSSGNVGIGISNPSTILNIKGLDPTLYIQSNGGSASSLKFDAGHTFYLTDGTTQFVSALNSGSGNDLEIKSRNSSDADIGFVTGSAQRRMTITYAGNVGIGTSTPSNKLAITEAVGAVSTIPAVGSSGGTFGMFSDGGKYGLIGGALTTGNVFLQAQRVDGSAIAYNLLLQPSAGNVGIGTTSPSTKLDVYGGTFRLSSSNGSYYTDFINNVNASNAFEIQHHGQSILRTTGDAFGAITVGNNNSTLIVSPQNSNAYFTGNLGVGTSSPFARLSIQTTAGGSTSLFTVASSTSGAGTSTAFHISSNGLVGIGTAVPTRSLDVVATDTFSSGSLTGGPMISLYDNGGFSGSRRFTLQNTRDAVNNALLFNVENDAGTSLVRTAMAILSGGNVGIGTTTPWGLLSVNPNGITGPAFVVGSSTATSFVVTNSGSVAIGTTDPGAAKLKVQGGYIYANGGLAATNITSAWIGSTASLSLTSGATGVIAFINGSTEGMRMDSTGKLGLGTTTPTVLLTVGSSTPDSIASTNYYNSAYISGDLEVDGTIYGTTAPVYSSLGKHMVITTDGSGTLVASSTPQVAAIFATSTTATSTFAGGMNIGTNDAFTSPTSKLNIIGTAVSAGSTVVKNQKLFSLILPQESTYEQVADFWMGRWQDATNNARTALTISLNNASGSDADTDVMTLQSSGYVGIGTTSPSQKLEVYGGNIQLTGASQRISAAPGSGYITNLDLVAAEAGGAYGGNGATIRLQSATAAADGYILFSTNQGGVGSAERMRITNTGNIGIGLTNPGYKLEVNGTANFASTVYQGGVAFTAMNSQTNGRVRASDVGCAGSWASSCDGGNNGYMDFADALVSDSRLKKNVTTIDGGMLDKLARLRPVRYEWNDEYLNLNLPVNVPVEIGLIAQELKAEFPELVYDNTGDGYNHVDYQKFTAVLLGGIQELDERTRFISSASTSTALTILANGNVGIGTTTPNRALSVAGDVGATAFVNTSTKTSKKNISYATASSAEDMFNQLVNLKIATYRYNAEEDTAPLRLGFIAEDAQTTAPEILSPDGKGVDLYKLATFTLSGVQTLAGKVDAISGSLANATSTIATATWAIDETTGSTMLTTSADINLGGKSLLGALSIGGADGKWSIDENGKFVGEELDVNKVNAGEISVARDLNVAGNVGIGIATTSAPIAKLTIQGVSSTSTTFATLDVSGNASFAITGDGRVGLGTSAPKSALSISSPSPRLTLTDTASVIDSISGGNVGVGTTTKDWFVESRNGTFSIGEISGLSDNSSSSTENIYLSISATSTPVLTFAGDIKANIISAKAIISDSICVASFCDSFGSRTISSDKVALAESGIAEHFADLSAGDVEVGDIVAMSATTTPNTIVSAEATTTSAVLVRADKTNATSVVGIANVAGLTFSSTSTSPSVVFSGKTIVKVSTEGGVIKPGDRITLSSVPGVGMKATTSSQTIGIALGLFDGTQSATSTVTSVNVDGTFVYQGSVAVAVSVGWTRLDGALTNATSTSATLAVDSVSGRVLSQGVLDMSGFAVENVSAITSSSGTWSIDASGKLLADNIEVRGGIKVGSPERRSGITMYDEEFGTPYCLTISAGLPKTTSGECQDSSTATQTSSSSVVGAIVDAISGSVNALTEPTTTYTAPTIETTTATTTDTTTTPVDTTVVDTTATTTPTDTTTTTPTDTTVVDTTATTTTTSTVQ